MAAHRSVGTVAGIVGFLCTWAAVGAAPMPAPSLNLLGQGHTLSPTTQTGVPPDPTGDVGPDHYVQAVNGGLMIWDKAGTVLQASRLLNTLWAGYVGTNPGNGCATHNDGDPLVQYDQLADRWVVSQFSVDASNALTSPSFQCVAVSKTGDPTGAYWLYDFKTEGSGLADQVKMGVWPDGYYFSWNTFTQTGFQGVGVMAVDRAAMLQGSPATAQTFHVGASNFGMLPSDLEGSTVPAAGTPNAYFELGTNALKVFQFHVDWTTPANSTFTGPTTLPVTAFTEACGGGACIPQPSPGNQLESQGDLLMYRAPYRVFGDHDAVVLDHTVTAGATSGIRWYEIRGLEAGTPSVFQEGTYAPGDGVWRWMGSIAMDGSGNIALGFSASSSTLAPEIRYVGQLTSDPNGVFGQGEQVLFSGPGVESGTFSDGTAASRWGDYSTISVDPGDGCTFWYTSEYYASNGVASWDTRIGAFAFPSPECTGTVATTTTTSTSSSTTTSTTTSTLPGGTTSTTLVGSTTTTSTVVVTTTTSTTVPGSGFVPADGTMARCERNIARNVARLGAAIVRCRVLAAEAAFASRPFNEAACEQVARGSFDVRSGKLLASGLCPPCLAAAADAAKAIMGDAATAAGLTPYCGGTEPLP